MNFSRRRFLIGGALIAAAAGSFLLKDTVWIPSENGHSSTIEEKVREGYKRIASRACELLGEIGSLRVPGDAQYVQVMRSFSTTLQTMKQTGIIPGTATAEFYETVAKLIEYNIPASFKPATAEEMLRFAYEALGPLSKATTLDDFLRINNVAIKTLEGEESQVAFERNADGKIIRHLTLRYNQKTSAISAILSAHELVHIIQPAQQQKHALLSGDQSVHGYDQLWSTVAADPALNKRKEDINRSHHALYCYFDPEIEEEAKKAGIDIAPFQTYAREHMPAVNFLISLLEGDAMVQQSELFLTHPKLQKDQRINRLYALAGICLALSATQTTIRTSYYQSGYGLARYFMSNPREKELGFASPDYQRVFSDVFFPPI